VEDFKRVARKYVEAMAAIEEVKEELKKLIIKYVVANVDIGKCTEYAISENLGLPRSIVRNILLELSAEGILKAEEVGNAKPYVLTEMGIGIAIDWLNLSFTRKELNELLAAKEAERLDGMPRVSWGASDIINGKSVVRYRNYAADICLTTLIRRFLSYMHDPLTPKLEKAFGKQTIKELFLLYPEIGSFEKLLETLYPIKWITELYEVCEEASAEDVKRIVIDAYEKVLKKVLEKFKRFSRLLEDAGYEGLHEILNQKKVPFIYYSTKGEKEPKYVFRDEYLWASTLALREGCKVGEKMGVNPELLKEAMTLADILDIALEKKYRGVKNEGLSLMEWGIRELSK
jgi:ribosomal protein S25